MTTIGRALCLYMAGHCVFTGPLRVQSAIANQEDYCREYGIMSRVIFNDFFFFYRAIYENLFK